MPGVNKWIDGYLLVTLYMYTVNKWCCRLYKCLCYLSVALNSLEHNNRVGKLDLWTEG